MWWYWVASYETLLNYIPWVLKAWRNIYSTPALKPSLQNLNLVTVPGCLEQRFCDF